jgi:predicted O-methyltransferase YrrM
MMTSAKLGPDLQLLQNGPMCFQVAHASSPLAVLPGFTTIQGHCFLEEVDIRDDDDDHDDDDNSQKDDTSSTTKNTNNNKNKNKNKLYFGDNGKVYVGESYDMSCYDSVLPDFACRHIGGGLWLSGAAMLLFVDVNLGLFEGKRVLELGAGLGLAGIHAATAGSPSLVVLTDADTSVLSASVAQATAASRRDKRCEPGRMLVKQLDFDEPSSGLGVFDIVLASDCIYRGNIDAFFRCVLAHLAEDGLFVMFNALRPSSQDAMYAAQSIVDMDHDLCPRPHVDVVILKDGQRLTTRVLRVIGRKPPSAVHCV